MLQITCNAARDGIVNGLTMNVMLRKGRYEAHLATTDAELRMAQQLRYMCFIRGGAVERSDPIDADSFDDRCQHMLVTDRRTGQLVCCFRLMYLTADQIGDSYSAQYYELSSLRAYHGPMVEMGRFCIHPDVIDPDILRVAWGAMTKFVDDHGVELLFGCSSFIGTDQEAYLDAFDMLAERHLAPAPWLPKTKAPNVFRFAADRLCRPLDRKAAMRRMPPLLKTYLMMGGWVSDHAVVDTDLNTLHVFTGLEIKSIPPARARALRAVAG